MMIKTKDMDFPPALTFILPLPNHRLFAIFEEGSIMVYDLKERLQHPAFQPLREEALFQQAHLANGGYGVVWNDEIDLSEYEVWSKGKAVGTVEELAARA